MRTRSVIILVSTLLLGFLLGLATSAWVRHYKMKEFKAFTSIEGFRVRAISILEPTPEQEQLLIPVITEYGKKNLELKKKYREDFVNLMKEYRSTLYPLLTREQIERLESRSWRSKDDDHNRRGGGSGGDGPSQDRPARDHESYKMDCWDWMDLH